MSSIGWSAIASTAYGRLWSEPVVRSFEDFCDLERFGAANSVDGRQALGAEREPLIDRGKERGDHDVERSHGEADITNLGHLYQLVRDLEQLVNIGVDPDPCVDLEPERAWIGDRNEFQNPSVDEGPDSSTDGRFGH